MYRVPDWLQFCAQFFSCKLVQVPGGLEFKVRVSRFVKK